MLLKIEALESKTLTSVIFCLVHNIIMCKSKLLEESGFLDLFFLWAFWSFASVLGEPT